MVRPGGRNILSAECVSHNSSYHVWWTPRSGLMVFLGEAGFGTL